MRKRSVILALVIAVVVVGVAAGVAIATPASTPPVLTADTARGTVSGQINLNTDFENGSEVEIKTRGPMEFAVQRIVAQPGATFGWHRHPAENINVIQSGTLTLYHDENCTAGIQYGPGSVFSTSPEEIHLARNNGTTDVVFFATYFVPRTTPAQMLRIDAPSPGPGCPQ
jgi:quercetin dioxygenase-like cupin family protein